MTRTVFVSLLALLGACATVESENMIPTGLTVEHRLAGSVEISASGTSKRMGIGSSRVAGSQLEQALRAALLETGLFSSVMESGADYELYLRVDELTSPAASLDMRVDATLDWRLTDGTGERTLWETSIKTGFTASPDDAFAVKAREQFAIEQALQANLREGIARLAELDLPRR